MKKKPIEQVEIAVGMTFRIEDVPYEVYAIERRIEVRSAELSSKQLKENFQKRPLNRYWKGMPQIEDFDRGDVITETSTCFRARNKQLAWVIYLSLIIRKGAHEE